MRQPEGRPTAVSSQILLAEDEVLIRHDLAQRLRLAGYTVVEARNAEEAMTLLAAVTAPRLLITDVRMGGAFDGVRLARLARLRNPKIKIIVMSGHLTETKGLDLADAAFAKPFDVAQLLAKVRDLIGLAGDGRAQEVA
jgi:DNA-binding NtrC family response regulator